MSDISSIFWLHKINQDENNLARPKPLNITKIVPFLSFKQVSSFIILIETAINIKGQRLSTNELLVVTLPNWNNILYRKLVFSMACTNFFSFHFGLY